MADKEFTSIESFTVRSSFTISLLKIPLSDNTPLKDSMSLSGFLIKALSAGRVQNTTEDPSRFILMPAPEELFNTTSLERELVDAVYVPIPTSHLLKFSIV